MSGATPTVMLAIETENEASFVEAFERLSRICAGEILAGRTARVYAYRDDDEDPTS